MSALFGMNYPAMWQQAAASYAQMLPFMSGQPGGLPFGMAFPGISWPGSDPGGRDRSRDRGKGWDANTMQVQRRLMGRVIGRQGSVVKGIREMSGARIDIEDKDDEICLVRLSGKPEQVERAKAMIIEVTQSAGSSNGAQRGDDHFGGFGGRSRSRDRSRGRRGKSPDYLKLEHEGPIESIKVEQAFMGRVIGSKGTTINRVRKTSGAIITAEKESEEVSILKISGKDEAVRSARSQILLIVDSCRLEQDEGVEGKDGGLESKAKTAKLDYPAHIIGGIIGAKGVKIKAVRSSTGARISVDRVGDRTAIVIEGKDEEQVERAKAAVVTLAEEALKANESLVKQEASAPAGEGAADDKGSTGDEMVCKTEAEPVDAASEYLEFPGAAFGGIVGTGGSRIKDIRMQSGARVQVDKFDDRDICKVKIFGRRGQVRMAKEMVVSMAEESRSESFKGGSKGGHFRRDRGKGGGKDKDPDYEHVILPIPKAVLGKVIGRNGANIKSVMAESGAWLNVNSQDGDPCPLKIAGSMNSIRHAKALLRELLADLEVEVPALRSPVMGGRGGGDMSWLQDHAAFGLYGPMAAFGPMGSCGGPLGGCAGAMSPLGGFGAFALPGPWNMDPPPGVVRGRSPGRRASGGPDWDRSASRGREPHDSGRGRGGGRAERPLEAPLAVAPVEDVKSSIDLADL